MLLLESEGVGVGVFWPVLMMVGGGRVSLSRSGMCPSLPDSDRIGVLGLGRTGGLFVGGGGLDGRPLVEGVGGPPLGACTTCAWLRDLIRS